MSSKKPATPPATNCIHDTFCIGSGKPRRAVMASFVLLTSAQREGRHRGGGGGGRVEAGPPIEEHVYEGKTRRRAVHHFLKGGNGRGIPIGSGTVGAGGGGGWSGSVEFNCEEWGIAGKLRKIAGNCGKLRGIAGNCETAKNYGKLRDVKLRKIAKNCGPQPAPCLSGMNARWRPPSCTGRPVLCPVCVTGLCIDRETGESVGKAHFAGRSGL